MQDRACEQCVFCQVGPLSGYRYCKREAGEALPNFAHAMRLEGSPCGPDGRLHQISQPNAVQIQIAGDD